MSKADYSTENAGVAGTVNRPLLFGAGCAVLLLFGVVMAVLGAIFGLPAVRARLQINFAQQGQLLLLLYLGMLFSDLTTGTLSDRWGRKWVLVIGCLLVAGALAGLATAGSFGAAAGLILLLGIGGGGLNVAGNALVSDVYEERRGAAMNLSGAFYGVGALAVPLVLVGVAAPAQVLGWTAGICAACGAAIALLRFPAPLHRSSFSLLQSVRVARYPGLWVLMLLLLCQAGNEAAVAGWTSSFAGASGLRPRAAMAVLATMWAAMIVGRTLAGFVVAHLGKASTILLGGLLSVTGCAVLLAGHSPAMLALGAAVVGFSFGPIFQTGLSVAGDRYPRETGAVFGVLFASAVPGGMAWPWVVGEIAQHWAVRAGMVVPLAGAVAVCVLAAARRQWLGGAAADSDAA
jgi:fucose permease